MNLTLTRNSHKASYCDGVMMLPTGERLFSIEQPWLDNLKGKSCVPPGVYDLIPYQSPTHGSTWYLSNESLGVGAADSPRSYCEIHSANWADQLQGCIAFGLESFPLLDPKTNTVQPAVEESVAAIALIHKVLGDMFSGHTLTIV